MLSGGDVRVGLFELAKVFDETPHLFVGRCPPKVFGHRIPDSGQRVPLRHLVVRGGDLRVVLRRPIGTTGVLADPASGAKTLLDLFLIADNNRPPRLEVLVPDQHQRLHRLVGGVAPCTCDRLLRQPACLHQVDLQRLDLLLPGVPPLVEFSPRVVGNGHRPALSVGRCWVAVRVGVLLHVGRILLVVVRRVLIDADVG